MAFSCSYLLLEMHDSQPEIYHCPPTEQFPNSPLPVLLYKDALTPRTLFRGAQVRRILVRNGWTNAVVGGIDTQMHYHSNNHVVIAILRGWTDVVVGGYRGHRLSVYNGDVLIIPAGVAYKNLGRQSDIRGITAWSGGVKGDVCVGLPGERPAADFRINSVPKPNLDPLFGSPGPLLPVWEPYVNR